MLQTEFEFSAFKYNNLSSPVVFKTQIGRVLSREKAAEVGLYITSPRLREKRRLRAFHYNPSRE